MLSFQKHDFQRTSLFFEKTCILVLAHCKYLCIKCNSVCSGKCNDSHTTKRITTCRGRQQIRALVAHMFFFQLQIVESFLVFNEFMYCLFLGQSGAKEVSRLACSVKNPCTKIIWG